MVVFHIPLGAGNLWHTFLSLGAVTEQQAPLLLEVQIRLVMRLASSGSAKPLSAKTVAGVAWCGGP